MSRKKSMEPVTTVVAPVAPVRTRPVTWPGTLGPIEPVLVKDCENGFTIWHYAGEAFIVFSEGQVRAHCRSEKEAVKEVGEIIAWREFWPRKQALMDAYNAKLSSLEAEYSSRISRFAKKGKSNERTAQ